MAQNDINDFESLFAGSNEYGQFGEIAEDPVYPVDDQPAEDDEYYSSLFAQSDEFGNMPNMGPVEPIGIQEEDPTWQDYGRLVMSGGASIGQGVGWLLEKAGAGTVGKSIKDIGARSAQSWMEERLDVIGLDEKGLSAQAREAMQTELLGESQVEGAKFNKVKLMAAGSLLGTMAGMGLGGVFTKGLMAATGAQVGSTGAKVAAAVGYGAGEAGIAAPSAGAATEEEVLTMEHDTLMGSLEYQAAYEALAGLTEEERQQKAKELVADAAAGKAAAMTLLSTFILSAPFSGVVGRLAGSAKPATGRVAGAFKGAAEEAGQEFLQSGAESMAGNIAIQQEADPSRGVFEGTLEEAVGGAAAGGMMGGTVGALSRADATPDKPAPGPMEDLVGEEGSPPADNLDEQIDTTLRLGAEVISRKQRAAREQVEAEGGDALSQEVAAAKASVEDSDSLEAQMRDLYRVKRIQRRADEDAAYAETQQAEDIKRADIQAKAAKRYESGVSQLQADREKAQEAAQTKEDVVSKKVAIDKSAVEEAAQGQAEKTRVLKKAEARAKAAKDFAELKKRRRDMGLASPAEIAEDQVGQPAAPQDDAEVLVGPKGKNAAMAEAFTKAANEAATSTQNDLTAPTKAQIESGTYKKGHDKVEGLDVTIENPAGSERTAVDGSWTQKMKDHYGYILGTESAEGKDEQLDAFIGEDVGSKMVFVVDQINEKGDFDEHKVMMRYPNEVAARRAYLRNYPKGFKLGPMTSFTVAEFKEWLKKGDQTKALNPEKIVGALSPTPATAEQLEEVIQAETRKGGKRPRVLFRRNGRRQATSKVETERRSSERRDAWTYRKEVDAMSGNEKSALIKELRRTGRSNKLTGLPDREAWEKEALPGAVKKGNWIASIDADSLGWVNDNIGNEAGDQLLVKVAAALKKTMGDTVFHISGDEFWASGADKASLVRNLKIAQDLLKKAVVEYKGTTKRGLAFSFGLAKNAVAADRAMKKDKLTREEAGERVAKTARPAGVTMADEAETEGHKFKNFFSSITEGLAGKSSTGKEYTPVIKSLASRLTSPDTPVGRFTTEYLKHRGNFDDHITFSVPGFKDVQQLVGSALSTVYGKDAAILDVGASEGSFIKTVSAISGAQSIALDPNPDMQASFEATQVEGSAYSLTALGTAEQEGTYAWDEDGLPIYYFNPEGKKFDVVHEAMVFQFISPDRAGQISRLKELLKKDGVVIIEEKMFTEQQEANEVKKNAYKLQYFHQAEMTEKAREVLEGMDANTVHQTALETVLTDNFENVMQFWDSGNFKGYVLSDSAMAANRVVNAIGDTQSEYATVAGPRKVEPPLEKLRDFANEEAAAPVKVGQEQVRAVVASITAKLPLLKVRALESTSDLKAVNKEMYDWMVEDNALSAKGLFDTKTGEVYVFINNHTSVEDVVATVMHEGVAHRGLRLMLQDKLPGVLADVLENSDTSKLAAVAKRYSLDLTDANEKLMAAEEMIAEAAEKGIEAPWMQRVKDAIRQVLRDLGIVHKWTDADINALLRSTRAALRGTKPLSSIKIQEEVEVEDTGEVVTLSQRADSMLRRIDKRIAVCKKIKGCVK